MQRREHLQNVAQGRPSIRNAQAGQRRIGKDATRDKLHEVEFRTQDGDIAAIGVHLGHGNDLIDGGAVVVVPLQGRQHAKLAIQRVR